MNHQIWMVWFDHLFPPLMILIFPIFCTLVPARADCDQQAAVASGLLRKLWLLAVASLILYFAVYHAMGGGQWRQLWMLCFLQMPLMNHLLAAKNPSWVSPHAGARRVASLTSRTAEPVVPVTAWVAAWIYWGLVALVTGIGCAFNELPARLMFSASLFTGIGAIALAFGPMLVRTVLQEPEPMDPGHSSELEAAYHRHRRARSWMFFAMPLILITMFGGFAVAIAWLGSDPRTERQIGLIGGITGAVVGVLGGVAGTIFGIWRAKLNQKVRDLSDPAVGPSVSMPKT